MQRHGLQPERHLPLLQLADLQDVQDHPHQLAGALLGALQELVQARRSHHLDALHLDQLDVAHDARQGVLEVVDHHLHHRLLEPLHAHEFLVDRLDLRFLALQLVLQPLDPQDRAYLGEQLHLVDRLAQEVVGAVFQGLDLVLEGVERRDHDDRKETRLVPSLQALAQLETAHLGHHHVQ